MYFYYEDKRDLVLLRVLNLFVFVKIFMRWVQVFMFIYIATSSTNISPSILHITNPPTDSAALRMLVSP